MPIEPADLTARYPALAAANAGLIALCIGDAASEVDRAMWIDTDVDRATMALAAHYVAAALGSAGGGPQFITLPGGTTVETAGAVSTVAVGDVKVAFGAKGAPSSSSGGGAFSEAYAGDLASTPYGLEFLRLRARSFPAVAVA